MSQISLYTVDFVSDTLWPTIREPGSGRRQTQYAFFRSARAGVRGITLGWADFLQSPNLRRGSPRRLPSLPPCRCPPSTNCARLGRGVFTSPHPTHQRLSRGLPMALRKRGRRAGGRRSTLHRPDPAGRPSPWRWRWPWPWHCRCGPGNVKGAHEPAATDPQLGGGLRACALVPEGPRGALRAPRSGPEGSRPVGRLGRTGGSGIWPGFGPSPGAA